MTSKEPPKLAVLGGTPTFASTVHVGRPTLPDRERFFRRMGEILDRAWFTNDGPLVRELEENIARYLQVRHCVAVCNGTVGLELLIRALGLNGEIIMPSFTFVATAHAATWLGLEPVFCDIEPETHQINPLEAAALLTEKTAAILGVNLFGSVCDVAALEGLAKRRGVPLILDSAHAFGCSDGHRMVGGFGNAEVFSFHATKVFNTFEGGAVTTNDDHLAEQLRLMRNFGFAGYDRVVSVGTNAKMSEPCAAMGLTLLEDLPGILAHNRDNAGRYGDALGNIPGLVLRRPPDGHVSNHQYVVCEIDPGVCALRRDELHAVLASENVHARRYFFPGCHRMAPYDSGHPRRPLGITEQVADRVLCLPTGPSVGTHEIGKIGDILRRACEQAGAVRDALALE